MNTTLVITASTLYLIAATRLASALPNTGDNASHLAVKTQALTMGAVALLLNGIVLGGIIFVSGGLNLGFSNALSLIIWFVAALISVFALRRSVEYLLVIFFPMAALALALILLLPSHRLVAASAAPGLKIHILLSLIAHGLLMVAAFQALLLALQDHLFHHRRPAMIMRFLPPIQAMEELLVRFIIIGFALLSLGLGSGLVFVHDVLEQHLSHKMALSLLSWLMFGALLWGRWRQGWRGRSLIRWTVGGFCALTLAFFGSKFVLEMVLMRV